VSSRGTAGFTSRVESRLVDTTRTDDCEPPEPPTTQTSTTETNTDASQSNSSSNQNNDPSLIVGITNVDGFITNLAEEKGAPTRLLRQLAEQRREEIARSLLAEQPW